MTEAASFVAVDLGASSGRVMVSQWDGERFSLRELHRFPNNPVRVLGALHWDVLALWREIKAGLARYAEQYSDPPAGIGVDTWGLDFGILDGAGRLVGNPYHYRDDRTLGVAERAFEHVPWRRVFEETGIQFMRLNSLFQLLSLVEAHDPQLQTARTLLFMPDLFHYWLTGRHVAEYTIASTSQMLRAGEQAWATGLLEELGIPLEILPPLVEPGTILGDLLPEMEEALGFGASVPVIAPASHDTASAVAAIPELDQDSAYISSGTWSLVGVEMDTCVVSDQARDLNVTNEAGAAGTVRLLKNVTGMWLVQECRRQWRREGHALDWEELLSLARRADPLRSVLDPDAAEFVSPQDMPRAIQAYCRQAGEPVPESVGQVVRCCLESLALKYRYVVQALENLVDHRLKTIRIVGGGSQNSLLCQFTADACERPVVARPAEATALGNGMIQAIARGYLSGISTGREAVAASVERQYYRPQARDAWDEAFARLQDLMGRQSPAESA